jgi:exosortase
MLSPAGWWRAGILAVLFVLVYHQTIRTLLFQKWMTDGNWSHGFLIPVFSLYFLSIRREELARSVRAEARPSYLGAVVLAASLALYLLSAWWLRMGYPQALSIVGAIFGLTLLFGGSKVMRIAWFPILFLVLAIPLPDSLYREITMPLRQLASYLAALVLPILVPGLHAEAQAVVIDYVMPGKPPGLLNVEDACSGMRSTMAFVTLGVAIAYLGDRPAWQRVVMVLFCVPIALVCNTIRVVITGWLHVTGHEEWARGTPHQLLGMAMFGVALGLYLLLGVVLQHLFVEVEEASTQPASPVDRH